MVKRKLAIAADLENSQKDRPASTEAAEDVSSNPLCFRRLSVSITS